MALYQKYRPRSLDELVGQEFVRITLKSALESEKIAHAYLFFGSRGTGKTSTARILAREILLSGITPEYREDAIAHMDSGSFVDLIEIDGASNRKIEHARALIEKIKFAPTAGSKKVYIIDEVHMLTKEAFNALLKTIEEPPPHAYFLLATTELHKVPETIRSRCQTFTFQRFSPDQIAGRLSEIAEKEGIEFEHDALLIIAKKSTGGMRDAIGLFEQSAASGKVSVELLQRELGMVSAGQMEDFFSLLTQKNTSAAFDFVGQISAEGRPLADFCEYFLGFLREKLIAAVLEKQETMEIMTLLDLFEVARRGLKDAPIPTLPLEMAIVRATISPDSSPEKKWSLFGEKKQATPEKNPEKEKAQATPPSAPAQNYSSATEEIFPLTPENLAKNWPVILGHLSDPVAKAAFKSASFEVISETTIRFTFSAESWQKQCEEPTRMEKILSAIRLVFGDAVSVECCTKSVILEPVEALGKNPDEPANATDISGIFGSKS